MTDRNFGWTVEMRQRLRDRDLEDTQLRRAALICISTVHPKLRSVISSSSRRCQSIASERSQIGIRDPEQNPHQPARQPVSDDALDRHGARLAPAQQPGAEHEVGGIIEDRLHESRQNVRVVAVVGIQKHHDPWRRATGTSQFPNRRQSAQAGRAVSPLCLEDYGRPCACRRRSPSRRSIRCQQR